MITEPIDGFWDPDLISCLPDYNYGANLKITFTDHFFSLGGRFPGTREFYQHLFWSF